MSRALSWMNAGSLGLLCIQAFTYIPEVGHSFTDDNSRVLNNKLFLIYWLCGEDSPSERRGKNTAMKSCER